MKTVKNTLLLIIFFVVFFPKTNPAIASCGIKKITSYTLNSSICSIDAGTVEGVDMAANEASTTNTSTLTLNGTDITINANATLVTGTILSGVDPWSITLTAGGASYKSGNGLWVADSDVDGWAASGFTLYTSTASGRRRLGLMRSVSTADTNDALYSIANSSCAHGTCRDITLTYSGSTLTNADVLISLDTTTSISAAKMTSDCGDIRFWDSDETTSVPYWIESGCNTANTQIWIRIPSIPDGGKTIYMGYDGNTALDGQTAWSGSFHLLYNASCPTGWTRNTTMDNKYIYGNSTTYGSTGGTSSHTPANVTDTKTDSPGTNPADTGSTTSNIARGSHTHDWTVSFSAANNVLPPYRDMVLCKKSDFTIASGLISLFDASAPSGWTRFSALDDKFPRSASTYGGSGTSTTHNHAEAGITISAASVNQTAADGTNEVCAKTGHGGVVGSTDNANHVPPNISMIFASANSATYGITNMITMTDSIPPYGWTQFSPLNDKFPLGGTTYGTIGGSATHAHTGTANGSATSQTCNSGAVLRGQSHTTSFAYTTAADSNQPPYSTVIFIKRNTPSAITSIGNEYN